MTTPETSPAFAGARLEDEALVIRGTGPKPLSATLTGRRAQTRARITGGGKTWTVRLPLVASRWGGPELPLPSGEYRVQIEGVDVDAQVALKVLPGLRAALRGDRLEVGAPVDPAYDTADAQAALEHRYASHVAPLENAVFLESFYGRVAGCNPLAIDRELARVAPGVIRYWSVVDLSVKVPEGAIPVIEGSPEWWRARSAARLLVVNDWLRRRYVARPGQRVLQTWHGTPLKRLALHRPGFDPRRIGAVIKESRRWNVLLAQNPYAARILRKAYAFLGRPVWIEGYPRNDVLTTGDATTVRAELGIRPGEKVLLYAPTWRDDRQEIVDFLDPEQLAQETGSVVLVRGHSRTLIPGQDAEGARVIDVTGYPDTAPLLLAADALITDYSSVMFDFGVTGKPMYFLVPDMDHYRGELRGFYFDLAERAPGPLVTSQDELIAALAEDPAHYATRYAEWTARFNAREDGRASERVVARIFDQGLLAR
ncbi:CDP-glycerol glycerophosphotransferase family protein [Microbacterium stercoris]|uniref:CDP-glycerol glycerophosphotransferase family protein n=1 Tax=Microbacterium stercoris TaxID=2820289 RepID=A0A939QGS6_9MICO|nr:CDP-glycerol glycerophosphotransferase family protein [Microbacterium stercoris]MBO3662364.1 CDP-glycerol glycerophosphotransferase family protein [Microbacterium stercoris]MBO3664356.1 CDP-glycerol glycerophosphotransferase family protein [Microbacterium stercoris]